MKILTIKTDQETAELCVFDELKKLDCEIWKAHKELSKTILVKIEKIAGNTFGNIKNLEGVVVFEGPGSFTGLRIGVTIANSIAYGLNIPVVAAKDSDWQKNGISKLMAGEDDKITKPNYGAEANITTPKK